MGTGMVLENAVKYQKIDQTYGDSEGQSLILLNRHPAAIAEGRSRHPCGAMH